MTAFFRHQKSMLYRVRLRLLFCFGSIASGTFGDCPFLPLSFPTFFQRYVIESENPAYTYSERDRTWLRIAIVKADNRVVGFLFAFAKRYKK
jgi:hypothetical protein